MNEGIIADINKDYLLAEKLYNEEINSLETASEKAFTNLAFLYWAFASLEFEFNIPNNIPVDWSIIGGNSYLNILKKGLKIYPDSLELNFWNNYFPYRLFQTEFSERTCKDIMIKYEQNTSLVPYFFLHLFDKDLYSNELSKLFKECTDEPTAKNNYIKSFIP